MDKLKEENVDEVFSKNEVFDRNKIINMFNLYTQIHEQLVNKDAEIRRSESVFTLVNEQLGEEQLKEEPLNEDEPMENPMKYEIEIEIEEQVVTYDNVELVKEELKFDRNMKNEAIDTDELTSPISEYPVKKDVEEQVVCLNDIESTLYSNDKQVVCLNDITNFDENEIIAQFNEQIQKVDETVEISVPEPVKVLRVQPKRKPEKDAEVDDQNISPMIKRSRRTKQIATPTRRSSRIINHLYAKCNETNDELVNIGPNQSPISKIEFESMDWSCYKIATRKLMLLLFTSEVLKTHSLSGKKRSKQSAKPQLNPIIVEDIIDVVIKKCKKTVTEVRNVIGAKCMDMAKRRN